MLGRKYDIGADLERLFLRLGQRDGDIVGVPLGPAVDALGQLVVEEILRVETQPGALAVLPGGRTQVADGDLALAGSELRDLAELKRISLAGTAGEVVEDAPAHAFDRAFAVRLGELEIVDRAMRSQRDRVSLARGICDAMRAAQSNHGRDKDPGVKAAGKMHFRHPALSPGHTPVGK